MNLFVFRIKRLVPNVGKPIVEAADVKTFENLPQLWEWYNPEKNGHIARGWHQTIDEPSLKSFRKEMKADDEFDGGHAVIQYHISLEYDPKQLFDDDQLDFIRDLFTEQLSKMTVDGLIEARDAKASESTTIHIEELDIINVVQRRMHLEPYKDLIDFFERGRSGSFNT